MTTLASRFGGLLFRGDRLRVGWRVALFLSAFILVSGISFMPIVAMTLTTWLAARYVDRRPLASVGFVWEKGTFGQIGYGALLAAVMLSFIVLALLALTPSHLLEGVFESGALGVLGVLLLLHFVAAMFEEMLVRGYLFQTLMESIGPWTALTVTSMLFALIHIGNPGLEAFSLTSTLALLNLFLAGLFLGILVLKTRTLWAAISFHFAWNVVQGHAYGLPVSGFDLKELYNAMGPVPEFWSVVLDGPIWLSGGAFGPEASIITSIVLLAGAALVWHSRRLRAAPSALEMWQTHVPVRVSEYDRLPDS